MRTARRFISGHSRSARTGADSRLCESEIRGISSAHVSASHCSTAVFEVIFRSAFWVIGDDVVALCAEPPRSGNLVRSEAKRFGDDNSARPVRRYNLR